jgi:hypothetical protein
MNSVENSELDKSKATTGFHQTSLRRRDPGSGVQDH